MFNYGVVYNKDKSCIYMYFKFTMNQANRVTEKDLCSWIEKSLENKKLEKYDIKFTGNTEQGEGYIGEIVFTSVNAMTSENKKETLHLVIKHGKSNEKLRKTFPLKAAFRTEIHFYNKVVPAFKQFQIEKNVLDVFESVPKCYKTFDLDNMEALVFDNLKISGYDLCNRKETFNLCHLKVVLKEYGKLHALSFALRDQRVEEFNTITAFDADAYKGIMGSDLLKRSFQKNITETLNVLREKGELYLLEKLKHLVQKNPGEIILDLFEENEPQSVIIHGDSWSNNFMFKYQNVDKTTPIKFAILDWQMSALRSPVFDISYLIYSTSSQNELDKFDELMNVYYNSFSNFLRELGSNPEELFPYSSLQAHWRKYSLFGLLLMTIVLPMVLCDKEQAPVLENLQEDETFGDMLTLNNKEKDLCYSRLKAVINHYFENTF